MTPLANVATFDDCAPERRGVLASYGWMTPSRSDEHNRRSTDPDDATRSRVTIRDAVFVALGVAGMWGVQVATQAGLRSDIRDFGTRQESYQAQQNALNSSFQQQINEWRSETKLNRERDSDRQREIAELKGLLTGIGIVKEPKEERR